MNKNLNFRFITSDVLLSLVVTGFSQANAATIDVEGGTRGRQEINLV